MSDKKFYMRVPEALVEVSEEVYKASKYMDRHYKTLEEKDVRNRVISYDALDTDEILGAEMIPDPSAQSVEDQVITRIMAAKLRKCLSLLPEEDQQLIRSIYYDGLSEETTGKRLGISQPAISKKKGKILRKLQKLFDR